MATTLNKHVFVDTSALIASETDIAPCRKAIKDKLDEFDLRLTGSIVLMEYSRRVLREARYMIDLLLKTKSIPEAMRHLNRLTSRHSRKKTICLGLLAELLDRDEANVRFDRAISYLQSFITYRPGVLRKRYEVITKVACTAAQGNIRRKRTGTFEFPKFDCVRNQNCGIGRSLEAFSTTLKKIKEQIGILPKKTAELEKIEQAIAELLNNKHLNANGLQLCSKGAGDLLIALESMAIKDFLTLNAAESKHLCRVLNQTMILITKNEKTPVVTCTTIAEYDALDL